MSEILIKIPVEDFVLQALHEQQSKESPEIAILCHPHPLYGGSMHNNVVESMQQALHRRGWDTVRFNFRGVGESGGHYGDGVGEVKDVSAVASYFSAQGKSKFHFAGYSFGAWVLLRVLAAGLVPASLLLVSPPVDFMDFSGLKLADVPCLITLGDKDPFCPVSSLRHWLSSQPAAVRKPDIEILSGCDHFYWGREHQLSARINHFLQNQFKADVAEKSHEPTG